MGDRGARAWDLDSLHDPAPGRLHAELGYDAAGSDPRGTFAQPLDPDKPLQQFDIEDIGVFAAMAFEDPQRGIGREVVLAGDQPTMLQMAEAFSRVTGGGVNYFQVPWDRFREFAGEEITIMYRWVNEAGYEADIAALREEYPYLTTLEQYLRTHGWEVAATSVWGQRIHEVGRGDHSEAEPRTKHWAKPSPTCGTPT